MTKKNILKELSVLYDTSLLVKQVAYKIIASSTFDKNLYLQNFLKNSQVITDIQDKLYGYEYTIEDVQNLFEQSIDKNKQKENGVVYTPNYIVDYIIEQTIDLDDIKNKIIVDPACGCGAFITGLIKKLQFMDKTDLIKFISNNIYGFDLNPNCKSDIELIVNIQLLTMNKSSDDLNINIICIDSLFEDWNKFLPKNPDYIIGNPPYVKVQNLNKNYMNNLKNKFVTTKSGGFNLFYAFIEKSMSILKENGILGFIIPNNFMKIKSGVELRKYISQNSYLKKLIDFDCNMIFAPVMTYNCIIILEKNKNNTVEYSVLEKTDDIKKELYSAKFNVINCNDLDIDGWLLLPESSKLKINKIESFQNKIGDLIKTGIATLRDKLYIIDKVQNGKYFKEFNGKLYEIESSMIRALYKVPEISDVNDIGKNKKFIIFPYDSNSDRPRPIQESILEKKYPLTYRYFISIKSSLDERNKFKVSAFYEYGRSQGLNNKGKKLMYSQFLDSPKFIYCEDENALICNGFAIYETEKINILCLQKILQSSVMKFYIDNISYSIDGGYKCYQKKYLKNFSYPNLEAYQIEYILKEENEEFLNKYIEKLYGLDL